MNISVINKDLYRCSYCGEWKDAYEQEVWQVDADTQCAGPDDGYMYVESEPEYVTYYRSECCDEPCNEEDSKFYQCGECEQKYSSYDRDDAVSCCR